MTFHGLLGLNVPYCPFCEHNVHLDYVFNEIRLIGTTDSSLEAVEYKCIKCGTEMLIESHGDGWYDIYPDEDTFPSDWEFDHSEICGNDPSASQTNEGNLLDLLGGGES